MCFIIGLWLPHSVASAAPLVLDAELPAELRACLSLEQLQAAYQRALAAHSGEAAAASTLHVSVRSIPGPTPDTLKLEVTASTEQRPSAPRERATSESDLHEPGPQRESAPHERVTRAVEARDGSREAGARDGSREAGARDGSRAAGARDGSREAGARDGSREAGARDGSREAGARDGSREAGARDGSREAGARERVARVSEPRAGGMRELGMRELQVHASDCSALADAIGLVLALLARDSAASDVTAVGIEPAPAPTPTLAPLPDAAPEPEHRVDPVHTEHLALGAGVGAVFGVLPSAALALQLQAATPGERLSLRFKAAMLLPREKRLAEGIIEARSYEIGLEICSGVKLPSWPRLALRVCAGPRLGLIYARGRDFLVHNQRQREIALYVGLSPEVALRLGGTTWLQLNGGGEVALIRPHFEVERTVGKGLLGLETPEILRADVSLSLVQIF